MENWTVELKSDGKSLTEVKIQRDLPGRCTITLLFVKAMVPLNLLLKKCTGVYKFYNPQDKINYVHGRHQTVCQKLKRIGNPNIGNEDIQSRYRNGICHIFLCQANNEKRKTTKDIFGLVWFGSVLWHINLCMLFNAKSIFMKIITSISNNLV